MQPIQGWDELPYAWGGPVGSGSIRAYPEDFQVVEVPLVSPAGEGEHCWLYVKKRNSNTEWVARQLARFAGVAPSAVSYAGLKDRNAVTEQWFSVHLPGLPDPDWKALVGDEFQVLEWSRHQRKLKRGALSGNRFVLRIRDVQAPRDAIETRCRQLASGGFPNCFGPQRFGRKGANLELAAKLFRFPKRRLPRHQRSIGLSAVRSALFNRLLAQRIRDASWNTALAGDVLQLDGKSACFVSERPDALIEQRIKAMELHPTGPLCGDGEVLVKGEAAQFEAGQLAPYREWIEGLKKFRVEAARRALRAVPAGLEWRYEGHDSWELRFFLPSGCYATAVLREVFELVRDA
ncbi:tRNA pseudouridine(13) synthase TruD [Thiogranum longum]